MTDIPEHLVSICRDMARTCRENGLTRASGVIRPGWKDAWQTEVHWDWVTGRHDEENNNLKITAHVETRTTLKTMVKA